MKHYLSAALALTLAFCMLCLPVSAARTGSDDPSSSTNYDVQIKVAEGSVTHKYYVDIDYPTELVFTYTRDNTVWDPESYTYVSDGTGAPGWTGPITFKIRNHSDQGIHYAATASGLESRYGNLSIVLTNAEADIGACGVGTTVNSMYKEFTVGVSGTPNSELGSTAVKLGTVTVAISKATP